MIIFVSDIHLTDTKSRSTFNTRWFFDQVRDLVDNAVERKIEDIRIIFLGDIFELLKSDLWLDAKVRPWESTSSVHVNTVETIFKSIVDTNADFFSEINALKANYPLISFDYIPGNHDRPINTEMGLSARKLLQEKIPLPRTGGETFSRIYVDKTHGVIARHGHEWDPQNRYDELNMTTVAFGDAIVIDIIAQLPLIVREKLNIRSNDDPLLEYLYELDNVRPHTMRVIAQWLNGGLEKMRRINPKAPKVINETVTDLAKHLVKLARNIPFESFAINTRRRKVATWVLLHKISVWGFLKVAHRFPSLDQGLGPYRDHALEDFYSYGKEYRYVVCGHTHAPLIIPLDTRDRNRARLYINTGTWRRVRPVAYSVNKRSKQMGFACWDEETLVTIFSTEEQREFQTPAFNFHRSTRGK